MLHHSREAMHKTLEDCFRSEGNPSQGGFFDDHCSKSEGNSSNYSYDQKIGAQHSIRKSISFGSGLDREGMASIQSDLESEKRENGEGIGPLVEGNSLDIITENDSQEASPSDSIRVCSDMGHNESVPSVEVRPQLSKDDHDMNTSDHQLSGEGACDLNDSTPNIPPLMTKSKSFDNICSSEDLSILEENISTQVNKGVCDSYDYVGPAKDWIVPGMNVVHADNFFPGESSSCRFEDPPSKDFKIKRIEEWVSCLQQFSPSEEMDEGLTSVDDLHTQTGATVADDDVNSVRFNDRVNPSMEAVTKYISSLTPTATAANLANHGLVVVPLLSAFVSLRMLNLSGNFIVKITAGALPRALHVLNLSKNSISTIEGLRELTRLRVLDLSYNRIVRIGHGLASCSSLKELYLTGNKISEVEGLHRLLKLNVLDLRFNKISTAKSLGQLAANYGSLQAISLEGNPAQKNVGDEQLKKYLQGLLPQLAYFNRQSIKTKTLGDTLDRSARLGITSNRGLRYNSKTLRKENHVGTTHNKLSSSLVHGQRNQAILLTKPSKACKPPSGMKTSSPYRSHFSVVGTKVLGLGADLSMRRSRSEGTLGAL